MAIELPAAQKVYTTKYDNFKGVDFTNDSTNIWRRRSPTGVNMLPDASGRPFKRHGWDILLSNRELSDALLLYNYVAATGLTEDEFKLDQMKYYTEDGGVYIQCTLESVFDAGETYYFREYWTNCTILKCAYFELAGYDHIVIFTDMGVIFYNGEFTATNTDYDCYTGYDRSFFFEGDGTSAFYIYGNFRVWRYSYNGSFVFEEVTDKLTVPRTVIGASADGTGTVYEGFNLFGTLASIEYNNKDLFAYWCSDGLSISVPDSFKSNPAGTYKWTWNKNATPPAWETTGSVSFASSGIVEFGTKDATKQYEIVVVLGNGVLLPNNVTDISKVKVWASGSTQYDTPLTVIDESGSLVSGKCMLHPDTTQNRKNGRAWIEFYDTWTEIVEGEDYIKVEYPSISISVTPYTNEHINDQADLVIEV